MYAKEKKWEGEAGEADGVQQLVYQIHVEPSVVND